MNFGKRFEEDFKASVPSSSLLIRLNDSPQAFSKSSITRFTHRTPCDFLVFDSINRNYYINTGVTLAGVVEGNTGGYVDVSKLSYVTISSVSVQARFRLGLTNELSDTMTINSGVNLDSNTGKKTTIDTTNYKYLIKLLT